MIINAFMGLYAQETCGIANMAPVLLSVGTNGYQIEVGGFYSNLKYLSGWIEFATDAKNIGS